MTYNEVIIRGGLGNQIFCLLQAYRILLKGNKNIFLNNSVYGYHKRQDRPFLLKSLYPDLLKDFVISKRKRGFISYFFARIIEKYFMFSQKNRIPGDKSFSINFLNIYKLYCGYFQNIDDNQLDQKALNLLITKVQHNLKEPTINKLAIHIRRGDFCSPLNPNHGLIQEKYIYEEAKIMLTKTNFDGITIFTDSPEMIDINIFKSLELKVEIDNTNDNIILFKKMLNHKGLIASNSTLSLWAGVIGRIKYFSLPKYWMKNVNSDLIGLSYVRRYNCNEIL